MARSFDGVDDKIDWGDVTFLDGATQATWIMWVRPNWAGSADSANAWRKDGAWTPLQRAGASDNFQFAIWWPSLTTVAASGHTWTADVWHFYAAVLDRSLSTQRLKMYAAGPAAASLTLIGHNDLNGTDSLVDSANAMLMGSAGTFEHFAGRIGPTAILSTPLTTSELLAVKAHFSHVAWHGASLKFYAPMWGSGSPEPDLSGNRASGAVTGAVAADHAPVGSYAPWLATAGVIAASMGRMSPATLAQATASGATKNAPAATQGAKATATMGGP